MTTIPVIASAADIDQAVVYAHRRPEARWYVARRAEALGASSKIPKSWGIAAAGPPQAVRDKMADKGAALPDGSFPIANREDLDKAVKAFGRAKDKAKAKRHIIKRARALKAVSALPESWGITATGALVAASIRGIARRIAWDPALHPRGRDGRFIEKNGSVNIFEGAGFRTPEARGRAVGVRREGDDELVQVEITDAPSGGEYKPGDTVEVDVENIEAGPEEKARIDRNEQAYFDTGTPAIPDRPEPPADENVEAEPEEEGRLDRNELAYFDTGTPAIPDRPEFVDEDADEITPQDEMLSDEADTGIEDATDWQNAAHDELVRRGVSGTSIDDFFARAQPTAEEAFENGDSVEQWVDSNMEALEEDIEYEGDEDEFIDSVRARLDEMGVQYDLGTVDDDIVELFRSTNDPDVDSTVQTLSERLGANEEEIVEGEGETEVPSGIFAKNDIPAPPKGGGDDDPRGWTGRRVNLTTEDGQQLQGHITVRRGEYPLQDEYAVSLDGQPITSKITAIEEALPESFVVEGEETVTPDPDFPPYPLPEHQPEFDRDRLNALIEDARAADRARLRKMLRDRRNLLRTQQVRRQMQLDGSRSDQDERQSEWVIAYLESLLAQKPTRRGTTASGAEDPREALRRRVHGEG